jgi:uncharacterized repeat protein (TIGR03847 family)
MARIVFEYDPPDRFVAGTVGEPGQRTFYLQATGEGRTTSVALEKQQVAALAERVEALLDEVVRQSSGEAAVPAVTPADVTDSDPLASPVEEEFRVGTMAIAWDTDDEVVVIEAQELTEDDADEADDADDADDTDDTGRPLIDDEAEEGPTLLRVRISGATARAFVSRAQAVVAAGRPPCPFCGGPLDAGGHVCPRANGYRR